MGRKEKEGRVRGREGEALDGRKRERERANKTVASSTTAVVSSKFKTDQNIKSERPFFLD